MMRETSDDYITIDQRILNLLKYTIEVAVDSELSPEKLEIITYELPEMIKFKINSGIYGEMVGNREIAVPLTWWQHFKLTFFPSWILTHFPIKYKVYDIDVKCLYPNFRPIHNLNHKYVYVTEKRII